MGVLEVRQLRTSAKGALEGLDDGVAFLVVHGLQIPDRVDLARVVHVHENTVSVAKHAEEGFGTTLVIASRELEEVVAQEEGILRSLGVGHHLSEVVLHAMPDAVVLAGEHGDLHLVTPEDTLPVLLEEHVPNFPRCVCRVEAVHEALAEGLHEVILRLIVCWIGTRVLDALPEVLHLAEGGDSPGAVEVREGPGEGQRDRVARHSDLLLRLEDPIEDGGRRPASLPARSHLEVGLVGHDQSLEGRMVGREVLHREPQQQVLLVVEVRLLEAVVVMQDTVVRALDEAKVAHAGHDVDAAPQSFVEKGSMARVGVVAVHPHGVGAEVLDELHVTSPPAEELRAGDVSHEVVVGEARVG
mmetsp:Transcript_59772/g.177866  ORF Transcript_59772/g.177866 Transcript_59772/m.177866 type:complete len:357 (-) Transcript_59772:895-1965(-)